MQYRALHYMQSHGKNTRNTMHMHRKHTHTGHLYELWPGNALSKEELHMTAQTYYHTEFYIFSHLCRDYICRQKIMMIITIIINI